MAYDLKTVSAETIQRRALRTGDGSWAGAKDEANTDKSNGCVENDEDHVWGWNDSKMTDELRQTATIIC